MQSRYFQKYFLAANLELQSKNWETEPGAWSSVFYNRFNVLMAIPIQMLANTSGPWVYDKFVPENCGIESKCHNLEPML